MRLTSTWKLACFFIIFLLVILLVDGGDDNENEKNVKPKAKPSKITSPNKKNSAKEKIVKKKPKEKSKDSEESDEDEKEKSSKVSSPAESEKNIIETPAIVTEARDLTLNAPLVNISSTQLALNSTLNASSVNINNDTYLSLNSTLNGSLVNSSIAHSTFNETLFGFTGNSSNATADTRHPNYWSDYHRYHGYHRFHGTGCGGSNTQETNLEKVQNDLTALWAYVQAIRQPVHVHVYNRENAYPPPRSERPEASKPRENVEPMDKSKNHTLDHSHNHTHNHNHSKHHRHGMDHDRHYKHAHQHPGHAHHQDGAKDYHHGHAHQQGDARDYHHGHAHEHHDHAHPQDGARDYHHGHAHQHYHHGHEKDMKEKARPYFRRDLPKHETHVHIHIVQREAHTGKEDPQVHIHHGEHNHTEDHKPLTEDHKPGTQKEYKPFNSLSARCDIQTFNTGSNISGVILFNQKSVDELVVEVKMKGFPEPTLMAWDETTNETSAYSLHGIHVHEYGDLSSGCSSLGGHFNPEGVDHGLRNHQVHGHVGDWGNLKVGSDGRVDKQFSVMAASLSGPHSILGRGIVVHAQRDDLGLGGSVASKTTGDAGGRIACCVIVAIKP